MLLVKLVIPVHSESKVNQPGDWQFAGYEAILKDKILRLEVTMADLPRVHVVQGKKELVEDVGTVLLIESPTLVNLGLELATLVERHHEIEHLFYRAEINLNWVHHEGVVKLAQDVELALCVVFVPRLKRDCLHCKLDLVVVLLLN